MISAKPIAQSLKRLAASDTPRKRRNALRHFRRVLREFEAAALAEYRPLRADGSVIEATRRKGARCPYCRVPFRSIGQLTVHLVTKHGLRFADRHGYPMCICGKRFARGDQVTRHLAAQTDLALHCAKAALLETTRKLRGAP